LVQECVSSKLSEGSMKLFIATTVFGLGAANLANPRHQKCLDIKAPCVDGSDSAGCDRKAASELEAGANLQMWECHGKDNQKFEIFDGRLRNVATNLCVDIKALCKDGTDTAGCKRQSLDAIQDEANVQLWTCRKDDAKGFASASYGNQKFDLMKTGVLNNSRTTFCLTAHVGEGDATNGANVHINKCGAVDQAGDQIFFWKAEVESSEFTRLVEVRDTVLLPAASGSPAAFTAMAVGACASVVMAAVAVVRSRRSAKEELPVTNGYE